MFLSTLVCLLVGLCKNYAACFHKIQWKVARELQKKPLDFGGNLIIIC